MPLRAPTNAGRREIWKAVLLGLSELVGLVLLGYVIITFR